MKAALQLVVENAPRNPRRRLGIVVSRALTPTPADQIAPSPDRPPTLADLTPTHPDRTRTPAERMSPTPDRTPTPSARTPDLQERTPDLQERTPDLQEWTPDLQEWTPDLQERTPDLQERTPKASDRMLIDRFLHFSPFVAIFNQSAPLPLVLMHLGTPLPEAQLRPSPGSKCNLGTTRIKNLSYQPHPSTRRPPFYTELLRENLFSHRLMRRNPFPSSKPSLSPNSELGVLALLP